MLKVNNNKVYFIAEISGNHGKSKKNLFKIIDKAKEAKALTIEIFDEEGFEMSVSNPINIIKGKNYKALDVETLEDGKYFFLLTDGKGKELVREITIAHKK